eukprot:5244622-Pyramimonas_sp.AAC.1
MLSGTTGGTTWEVPVLRRCFRMRSLLQCVGGKRDIIPRCRSSTRHARGDWHEVRPELAVLR